MDLGLRGRVAIVTGAARGMGHAIARRLAAEGANLALWDLEGCPDTLKAMQALGVDAISQRVDVSRLADVEAAVQRVIDRWHRLDILINNAGIVGKGQRLGEIDPAVWERVLAVNLTGAMYCAQSVVPHMKAARWGRIVNAGSFAALIPSAGGSAYAASKAAVVCLTRVWAGELGRWGITVNAYIPGTIETEMTRYGVMHHPKALLDLLSIRRFGQPDDVADVVAFLASEPAHYVTGAAVEVTGGKLVIQRPGDEYEQP